MYKVNKRQVALSAGGTAKDFEAYGIGSEHIDELMVAVARDLLQAGQRLAFGGTLGDEKQGLTKTLIETSQNWLNENSARNVDVQDPSTWPMVNYSSWPYYERVSSEYRARLVGICEFIDIPVPNVEKKMLDAAKRHTADALTAMRERMTRESKLRIVWGGRIAGAEGWIPGILEEVVMSLKLKKPVLILGGFGGCARIIADFLAADDDVWPKPFAPPAATRLAANTELENNDVQIRQQRYDEAKQHLTEFRQALRAGKTVNKVPAKLQMEVLMRESMKSVKKAVGEVLKQVKA